MNKLFKAVIALSLLLGSGVVAANSLTATTPVLTLDGAKFIAAESAKKAKAENWQVIIVVSDANGQVKYLERMDNVQIASLETAILKAETAAMYKRPTKVFHERVQAGETPLTLLPNMLPFEGGVPIVVDGEVIGSVGVSGVKGHQDAEIAQTGIDAFIKELAK